MKKHSKSLSELVRRDPYLIPYTEKIKRRMERLKTMEEEINKGAGGMEKFASGHEYYGLHYRNKEWIFREWAPNATAIYLTGDFTGWNDETAFSLKRINDHGDWEIRLPSEKLHHKDLYRLSMYWDSGHAPRIPVYARYVVQDEKTKIFNAQIWRPSKPYTRKHQDFRRNKHEAPLIYEAHTGMAQEEGKIGSYNEFKDLILPRIVDAGYNTIQLMAIQQHPYYGSFGYHVANFFAPSSRFGTPDDLKELIDTAHGFDLSVIMDIVHSHAVRNEVEGISRFDGSEYQYFHEGARGNHEAWDSRCFDYGKKEVLHFLLSNCRFWLDEFHFDGFRFDGITSMLYLDHGLGRNFTSYDEYFNEQVDEDAVTYLTLANKLIHKVRPDALTISEDMSGMPGTARPPKEGGIGFDFRLGMGLPDFWIKIIKHERDEDWKMNELWHELNNRRQDEKTISYAESHDQALVGDQTVIFRLIGKEIYEHMRVSDGNMKVERGMALHKMIRLITAATGGNGYLNFMGNEFGHPEWIDFPREGNNWSYHYARRQWNLRDNIDLQYHFLAEFDKDMIKTAKNYNLLESPGSTLLHEHNSDMVLGFERAGLIFLFNFHPFQSYTDYAIDAPHGEYDLLFDTDSKDFGGHGRIKSPQKYFAITTTGNSNLKCYIQVYLPTRTAIVLRKGNS
tara:strand:- start:2915 stop:4942 length:2028 start_codon:yes stop_codon:yes gene_type:complete